MAQQHFIDISFSVNNREWKGGTEVMTRPTRVMIEGHKDLSGAFHEVASRFFEYEEKGWRKHDIGGSWGQLKPSTIAYKERYHSANTFKILVATGKLRDSLTQPHGNWQIWNIGKKEMVIGSEVEYAIFHQTGTKKMARRPVVPGVAYSNDPNHMKAMKEWHFDRVRQLIVKGGGRSGR